MIGARTSGTGRKSLPNNNKQPFVLYENPPCGNNQFSPTMPRRPRKHSASHGKTSTPPSDRSKGKMKPWNTVDEIPLDEEDECASTTSRSSAHTLTGSCLLPAPPYTQSVHASRDQILLNGDEMQYDEDDFGVEDEVFALKGVDSSSEDESGDEGLEVEGDSMDVDVDERPSTSLSTNGSKVKPTKGHKRATASSDSDESEDELEKETWGTKKSAYYSANDAHFDSEDEEANELEEKEARRLQMKAREGMGDEDFGLDGLQALVEDGGMESDVIGYVCFCSVVRLEALIDIPRGLVEDPVATPSLPQDKPSLLRHLEKDSPETLALARDWDDIATTVVKAGQRLKKFVKIYL